MSSGGLETTVLPNPIEIAHNQSRRDLRLLPHLARLEGNADKISAFEANLKNDNQRRARRFEILQANHEYRHACDAINRLNTEKAHAVARLEHLRNEFSVAKLETRLAIAQKLIGLETRELVGL
ncbi:MAG: hypothetical protein DCF22_12910 [Leptolyngbya sp.]|nr:MAG: hypothetical protein DCF22_12910 [Leptolyngbya sp.]